MLTLQVRVESEGDAQKQQKKCHAILVVTFNY